MTTFPNPREAAQRYVKNLRANGLDLSDDQASIFEDQVEVEFQRAIAAAYVRREAARQFDGPLRRLGKTFDRVSRKLTERAWHA